MELIKFIDHAWKRHIGLLQAFLGGFESLLTQCFGNGNVFQMWLALVACFLELRDSTVTAGFVPNGRTRIYNLSVYSQMPKLDLYCNVPHVKYATCQMAEENWFHHMVTYFGFPFVLLRGRSSNCLRYIRYNEIGMKGSGRKFLPTLGASGNSGASIPVFLDTLFTKMVHAFQHDRVPEEVIAYGTG